MPIDTISDMELDIAKQEAQGIRDQRGQERKLASDMDAPMQNAMRGIQGAMKVETDIQRQKEFDELLKSGAVGIGKFADELHLDPAEKQKFINMAKHIQDPKQFGNIYPMMQKVAQEAKARQARLGTMSSLSADLEKASTTSDPAEIAMIANRVNRMKADTVDPETIKQLESVEKGLNSARERLKTGSGDGLKTISEKLNLSRAEAKHFDNRVKEQKIIKSKAESVMIAVNRAIENVQSGKEPNNATLDQVLGVSLQKILDPGSVVRESEFDRLGMSQAFLSAMEGKWKALFSGGIGLTDTGRANTVQFIKDMKLVADRDIRKEMMTAALRSGFGKRFDPAEIDASLFTPEEVEKMRKMSAGEYEDADKELDARIRKNVEWFLSNPNIISKRVKRTKDGAKAESAPPTPTQTQAATPPVEQSAAEESADIYDEESKAELEASIAADEAELLALENEE